MGDDKNKGSLIPISGVFIILAALGVTIFTQPFKGDRPLVSEVRESYKKINARLWQDPFRAVLDGVKGSETPPSAGQFDIEESPNKQKKAPFNKFTYLKKINEKGVTVLGVMVPGAPYFEDTEMRMRFRYAVLSGLNRVGFIPDDPEHIEYIKIAHSKKITLSNIMPFEWLTHTEEKNNSVLILWISDNVFQEAPLSKLARLAEYLNLPSESPPDKIKFKIIGPTQSSTLREMVREASGCYKDRKGMKAIQNIGIYSAMATVDDALLLRDSQCGESSESDARKNITSLFDHKKIKFIRTIGSDGNLAATLIEELMNRGVKLEGRKAHLLLVAEWDTYYGRSFEYVFKEVLKGKGIDLREVDRRIHRISYLRGIDGSLPGEKGKKEEPEEKGDGKAEDKSDPLKDIKKLEQPVGKSQYDYLRRLAEETYHLDQDIKAKNQGEIKAIGVVGTDFYDKYLVLQALRQRFPDVVFFTTDLDARYVHPNHFRWTRNLVVASNFGLSLRKDPAVDIQGEFPPFRDNYQTSIFLAVLRAFNDGTYLDKTDNDKKIKELIKKPLEPLIFEIGRHEATLLTDPGNTIHPGTRQNRGDITFYGKIVTIIVFVFIFFFFASAHINNFTWQLIRSDWELKVMTVISILLIVVIIASIHQISNMADEEPFSIFEGISVWPTVLFRLVAISLSVFFLYSSWKDGKKNIELINHEFSFKKEDDKNPSKDKDSKTGRWAATCNWMKNVAHLDWKPENNTLADFWFKYVGCASDQYQVWRVIMITFFYFGFCGLIIKFDPPVSPVRGTITYIINITLVFVGVISLVALISYVLDVTRCCRRFIAIASDEFSKKLVDPSDEAIQKQIKNQGDLVRVISMRTETVGKLIFYPFIVWLVMFVSRLDYFDNWVTPPGLAAIISLGALYAWMCAFLLRRSAERARTSVIERLKNLLFEVRYSPQPNQDMIKRIEFMIAEVRSIRQGAFAPFMQHPVVQSLFVPFGGIGGIYLVDFFAKMNF